MPELSVNKMQLAMIANALREERRRLVYWYGGPVDRAETEEVAKEIGQPHEVVHLVMEKIVDLDFLIDTLDD